MENRFQYILLVLVSVLAGLLGLSSIANAQTADDKSQFAVGTEFLEIGLSLGMINIEDFPSETATGIHFTFRATEDYFLQLNYMKTSEVSTSTFEEQGSLTSVSGSDREFIHYDVLLGYNLYQGEFFSADSKEANLSSLYLVGGVGETEFRNESRFTYTLGVGYRVAFKRRYIVHVDVRDYNHKTSLNASGDRVNNIHWSAGVSYLF
ncbi:MAG: outer membrane beta-barrel domain-containing protein [Cellvibrionaceae bacterium]